MIGTCDQSNEFLLVHMSASMFKLSVIEVRIVRLEHVSIDFAAAWSYLVVCVLYSGFSAVLPFLGSVARDTGESDDPWRTVEISLSNCPILVFSKILFLKFLETECHIVIM